MSASLSHIRVLDLSRVLAGPWATQTLADLGAEVLKIERPHGGDETRGWGPPYLRDRAGGTSSESAYFLCANRNKKSVALDIASPAGQDIVKQLAVTCDVLVENFKVGTLDGFGLGYQAIREVAPHIVHCSITGFGQSGPYAMRGGYDFLIQGIGGLMSVTGRPDGEAGGGPMKTGVALTDLLTGLYASTAILAALAHRERTGRGQHIEIALLDVQVACLANQALNYLTTGAPPRRSGNAHPNIVPYEDFPTADGAMILAIGNDAQFERFCAVAERPELARDSRYATNAARVAHRQALIPLVREITRKRRTPEWIDRLEAAGVPCGPINDLAAVFADPQVQHRKLAFELPHAHGAAPTVASPLRLSETPVEYSRAPPLLGEHTHQVLRERLSMTDEDIERLERAGFIQTCASRNLS